MSDVRDGIPPSVLEPGPRTAQRTTSFFVAFAIVAATVAILGTAGMLVYLIASGRI